ncbi:hypothetical protein [Klebsiella pneumoniae]|uniref:hypothetical protein n=1 Tax=Klebsiella pneumoniae TaxID=573 RepID=UPI00158896C0|nr:hypothetical protein [Klebsiella pneumoniae]
MVKKSLRQFTLMATATVTLLLGSVPLYAQSIVKFLYKKPSCGRCSVCWLMKLS